MRNDARSVKLLFSEKCNREHEQRYLKKHQSGLSRTLPYRREEQIARWALKKANEPALVLDLPCGAGRFWPLLAEYENRIIIAADNSQHMIDTALSNQPREIARKVKTFQSSAFSITLNDNAVDSIFCIRLIHHVQQPEHRLVMLREFHRVTRDTLIISLWVDGNFKAWKRAREERRRIQKGQREEGNRFLIPRSVIEDEFHQAGFDVVDYKDLIPGYSMWRIYVLKKQQTE